MRRTARGVEEEEVAVFVAAGDGHAARDVRGFLQEFAGWGGCPEEEFFVRELAGEAGEQWFCEKGVAEAVGADDEYAVGGWADERDEAAEGVADVEGCGQEPSARGGDGGEKRGGPAIIRDAFGPGYSAIHGHGYSPITCAQVGPRLDWWSQGRVAFFRKSSLR